MKNRSPSEKVAYIIRIITIPPVMTSVLILLYALYSSIFSSAWNIAEMFLFLVLIPISAYPVCRIIPGLHAGGRNTQRKIAFCFSGAGYLIAVLTGILFHRSSGMIFLYLTYMLSLIILAAVNQFLGVKASGHACSIIWPILFGSYYFWPFGAVVGVLIYGVAMWASVKTKRHTAVEYLTGSFVCIASAGLSASIVYLLPMLFD